MKTNIQLDDFLIEEGFRLTGLKTKKELANHAPDGLVRRKHPKIILYLKSKIDWEGDPNEMRDVRFL